MTSISINTDEKSPFYFVTFKAADGKYKRRSTKVPAAGGMFQGVKLSKAQAEKRALIEGTKIAEASQLEFESFDNRPIKAIFDLMLDGKLGRVTAETYNNARGSYKVFARWAGSRFSQPMRMWTRADMKEFVLWRRVQVRKETCRKDMAAIKAAFEWAVDSEIIPKNPCAKIAIPSDTKDEKIVHEAFTWEEVRTLVDKLPTEWSSAVRCCVGTYGQRLGDILSLEWKNFDWDAKTVAIITKKTGRVMSQPMQPDFYAWARAQYDRAQGLGGDAALWVHPRLRLHSNPSTEFTQLVRLHGIGLKGEASGGDRRTWHSKTFHSLRATVVTMLHAGGVGQGVAMNLVGHDSDAIHQVYMRPSAEQRAHAGGVLPTL